MVVIDQLIHAFHYGFNEDPGRPAANNLIEGSVTQVVQLLDDIGDKTFGLGELQTEHEAWRSTTSGMVLRRRSAPGPTVDEPPESYDSSIGMTP